MSQYKHMTINLYKKIKVLREENEFSQEYLADKLGVSRPTYVQVEKGERDITVPEARKLAMIFSLSLEDFLGDEASPPDVVLKKEKAKEKESDIRIIMPRADVKKFKEVLLYVLSKIGAKPNIGETALYKL